MRSVILAALLATTAVFVAAPDAGAGQKPKSKPAQVVEGGDHPKSYYYRRGPRVMGYIQRRGGYSFSVSDVINTYSNNRGMGATDSYRDPMVGRQSRAGPFDHGFFFESGVAPRGGNSPYQN
jgi:hypothetical protein